MIHSKLTPIYFLLFLVAFVNPDCSAQQEKGSVNKGNAKTLTVMAWNIWRGGREDGEKVGPQRVIDVIRDSGADIVAMQETYGSGEIISKELGFHFHPRGTNVSVHSRYPVVEDISVFEEFKVAGALIQLPDEQQIAALPSEHGYRAPDPDQGSADDSE